MESFSFIYFRISFLSRCTGIFSFSRYLDTVRRDSLKPFLCSNSVSSSSDRGCVLSGISAGAIAIAKSGLSDYQIINNISENYTFTEGLGILDINICPHADDLKRQKDLKLSLKNTNKKVLSLENGTALKVENEKFTIVKSIPSAKARLVYWENNTLVEEEYTKKNSEIGVLFRFYKRSYIRL